jgi:hypothetical protein
VLQGEISLEPDLQQPSAAGAQSPSAAAASGWAHIRNSTGLRGQGRGWRRMSTQIARNSAGHAAWADLFSGMMGDEEQGTRKILESEISVWLPVSASEAE